MGTRYNEIKEIAVDVDFSDQYGNTESIGLLVPIHFNCAPDEISMEIEEAVDDWYYDHAATLFGQIWRENGGGTEEEYEADFDAYLANCVCDVFVND